MLLQRIRAEKAFQDCNCITDACEENNICVVIDERIAKDDYVVIKVDTYYNSLGLGNTPAAPDCLIIQKCAEGVYAFTIVELKNINTSKALNLKNIKAKFINCLDIFMSKDFATYFDRDYKRMHLLFVSKVNPYQDHDDHLRNLKIKSLMVL